LISEEQVGMPQTAHSNRHHHRSRERRTGSHNTTSLPDKWLQYSNTVLETQRDSLSSVFEE